MGLDVALLTDARYVAPRSAAETDESLWERAVSVYNDEVFRDRADGRPEGFYEGDLRRVASWSYSGYGYFRDCIARRVMGAPQEMVWADPDRYASHPLWPLINFSDCEGAFGPETSRRLAAALAEHRDEMLEAFGDDVYDREQYVALTLAFEAAGEGAGDGREAFVLWR